MKIGIIGAGHIGGTLAGLLVKAGYDVCIANSRGKETLSGLVAELGDRAAPGTVREVAATCEWVIEAIPFGKLHQLPRPELDGKILITAANYYPGRDGVIDLKGLTESEYLQRLLPKTHIAKAFNTIYYVHLQREGDARKPLAQRRVLPFAASDNQAEDAARRLIEDLGFGPLFLGDLAATRGVSQPDDLLYNKQLTLSDAERLLKTPR